MQNTPVTFDDVLIVPRFSKIESRKDIDISVQLANFRMSLPVISANMDTITGVEMAKTMLFSGGQAALHRFCTIEENVKMFVESQLKGYSPFVSIGIGQKELDRAVALFDAGANTFIVDVAHGAQMSVVNQVKNLRTVLGFNACVVVGNFATGTSVKEFMKHVGKCVDGFKVGIGPGSACSTRIKTGVGYPQLAAVRNVVRALKGTGIAVIADGGMRTPGDIAKAIGAGAHMVMLGGMLSGTKESEAGQMFIRDEMESRAKSSPQFYGNPKHFTSEQLRENVSSWMDAQCTQLKYRGSASKESYESQGKVGKHRTAEGESFLVPYKGSVTDILDDIEGGLRSAMSYVGASNIEEFHQKCKFIRVSPSTVAENGAHGKKS